MYLPNKTEEAEQTHRSYGARIDVSHENRICICSVSCTPLCWYFTTNTMMKTTTTNCNITHGRIHSLQMNIRIQQQIHVCMACIIRCRWRRQQLRSYGHTGLFCSLPLSIIPILHVISFVLYVVHTYVSFHCLLFNWWLLRLLYCCCCCCASAAAPLLLPQP